MRPKDNGSEFGASFHSRLLDMVIHHVRIRTRIFRPPEAAWPTANNL
jgi:hypothetical protein